MSKTDEYWTRVALGLCIECGTYKPKSDKHKRCEDCLRRVAEYNANRRNKPSGINRVTYRQKQKLMPTVLDVIDNTLTNLMENKNDDASRLEQGTGISEDAESLGSDYVDGELIEESAA